MTVALITGATAGIGAAFARCLALAGYDLILVARDEDRLTATAGSLAAEHNVNATALAADLATDDGIAAAEQRARSADLVVNNAGFGNSAPFGQAPVGDELRMLKLHCEAILRLTGAAVQGMAQRDSNGHGVEPRGVINVSSVSAFTGRDTYGASKAWAVSFSLGVAADLAARGRTDHVMALGPGFTRTEFHQRAGINVASVPKLMWLDADRVAADAMPDFRRRKAVSIPGAQYKVIVALARFAPYR